MGIKIRTALGYQMNQEAGLGNHTDEGRWNLGWEKCGCGKGGRKDIQSYIIILI